LLLLFWAWIVCRLRFHKALFGCVSVGNGWQWLEKGKSSSSDCIGFSELIKLSLIFVSLVFLAAFFGVIVRLDFDAFLYIVQIFLFDACLFLWFQD